MKIKNAERDRGSRTFGFVAGFLTVVVLVLTLFYGCKKSSKPAPVQAVAPIQQPIEVIPETLSEEVKKEDVGYEYERKGRRDPFKPLIEVTRETERGGAKTTGTLESYDISDFTVLAIGKADGRYFALLKSPDNKSFTVNKGVTIGFNEGKVKDITPNEVITLEEFTDSFGKVKQRQIILELHKGEK